MPDTEKNLAIILKEGFNLNLIHSNKLVGYENLNYKLVDSNGIKYICKEYPTTPFNREFYAEESKILQQLSTLVPYCFQKPLETIDDGFLYEYVPGDEAKVYQVLTWLEGNFLAESTHSKELFSSYGKFLAIMDRELLKLDSSVIKARQFKWDLQYFLNLRDKLTFVTDPALRKLIHYYFVQYKESVLPQLHRLRKSIIHNDSNDWNVLVKEGKVSGMIDFGDLVYAPLIQELAVAITYAMFEKDDPVLWANYVIFGYNEILPLYGEELELLYYLIAARLCTSVIMSAEGIYNNPENKYLLVSRKPALELLHKWIALSPDYVEKSFKKTAGIEVHDSSDIHQEMEKRHRFISKSLSVSYTKPVKMRRAAFQYMFDADGHTFLDAYNNIPHVGHQHPKVVEAGQKQMAFLNTNTRYFYDQLPAYAEKLLAEFPSSLNKVFFVNSGSAGSDLAIRLAQNYTGNQNIMVLEHGYHGHTIMGVDISHYKFGRRGGTGQKENVIVAPIPDSFRGEFKNIDAGIKYSNQVSELFKQNNNSVAAFICEPVVGCGGQIPLPSGYLKDLYPAIRKQGGVCISDEVQTGFGRLGTHFWGFETHEVVPDIVVLGKPMGNGHPIGAVVTTDEIAEFFDNGMEFFSSFGGNPVSCEIGMAVLDVIKEEQLQQHAIETGSYFVQLLQELQKLFPVIGDVRGYGLFLGVELIKDQETLEPHTELAQFLKNKLRENFILVGTDGPFDNVIKIKPPLCFNKANADMVAEMLHASLKIC